MLVKVGELKLDGVEKCLLVLGVFIKLFDLLEFVQQVLVEDVSHNLVWVVSNQSWLNQIFFVVNGVHQLERVQEGSLHVDLLDQSLLVHLELDPTLLIEFVQLVETEAVETGFWECRDLGPEAFGTVFLACFEMPVRGGGLDTALTLKRAEILQLVVSDRLEPIIGYGAERQWYRVVTGDKGMAQRLKRRHPILGVDLQDLLHEVDELEYLQTLVISILHFDLIRVHDIVSLVDELLVSLSLPFQDVPLLQQLPKIEQRMVFLGHVVVATVLWFDTGHQKLLEGLQVERVLMLVIEEELVAVDRVVNHVHWWHPAKLNDF